jgi:hypothetical protein
MSIRLAAGLSVAALAFLAAGCGGGGSRHALPTTTSTTTSRPIGPCKLDARQRRTVALALSDIRRLRKIQEPLQKFSDRGTPAQEKGTGKFLLDVSSVKLPVNVRAHLLHLAKSSVGLCGLCFTAIESEEPVLATRLGEKRCG